MGVKQMRDYPNRPSESGHLTSEPAANSEKGLSRDELADLLGSLWIEPVRSRKALIEEIKSFLSERFQNGDGVVSDRTLWSYIRRHLTNYDEIRAVLKAKVGASELYENVKVYLCCRIIREFGLEVDPLYAAFGEAGSYGEIPDRFIVDNLEATATQLILQELLRGPVHSGGAIRRSDSRPVMRASGRRRNGRTVDKQQRTQE